MVLLFLQNNHPGVIVEDCVTAEASAELTGYNTGGWLMQTSWKRPGG